MMKGITEKVVNPLQTKVRGAPVWVWAAGIGLTALGAWGILRYTRSKRARKVKGKASKYSKWANILIIAMDGAGTNEVVIRKVLREIPSQQDWEKVQKSYEIIREQRETLLDRLEDELSVTEYTELLAIINSKPMLAKDAGATIYDPHGWASRINAAVNYRTWGFLWGTDTDALTAVVLDIPTIQAFMDTAAIYKQEYGVPLMTDLEGDLSPIEILKYRKMILQKPRE